MPSRGMGVVCLVTAPLLILCGCAIHPGSGLTASQARVQFYSVLDDTQHAVGTETWANLDDPTARGCVIPLLIEGRQFPGLRIGPVPRNPRAIVNQVYASWTSWGYKVERSVTGPVIELQGKRAFDEILIFRVSDKAMTLQGESECRPD